MQENQYKGLSAAQVEESRRLHGANILTPPPRESLWIKYLRTFRDPLIVVLLVAGVLSVCISLYEFYGLHEGAGVFFEPAGIFMAIFLATGLGFIFETKAAREFDLLNQVKDDDPVRVIRGGSPTEIPRRDVVVGDIVILEAGQEIPADGTLLEAVRLNVDESTLTGEPMCSKTTDPAHFDPESTYASNRVMRGTRIMEGHGVMEVTAVGDATENGKVFTAATIDDDVQTPLDEQLRRLGTMITRLSYIIGIAVVVGRVVMYFISVSEPSVLSFVAYFLQTIMIAVTLVVCSVPEGLPMAVTLSLANSMRRMLRTNNLVRKLHACETMGATTVICTDKTGTLTRNRMQVYEAEFYGTEGKKLGSDALSALIAEGIAVNSTAMLDRTDPAAVKVLGNPTEGALLLWLNGQNIDYDTLRNRAVTVEELPFSTERKYMATVVKSATGKRILYVKGAPEIVCSMCSVFPAGVTEKEISARLLDYQAMAMRTLGFACCELAGEETVIADGKLAPGLSLTFLGIVAISDPVRPDVPAAVEECMKAGIKIKIVTGDTPGTAREIGREIGLWDDTTDSDRNIITGTEFAALSDAELRSRAADIKIIARARPMDKKRLVEALRDAGDVVAVTGDGTNDAPALKAAHVGLSMGDGTAIAKEASDITIIDNSFASIGRAVMWGRSLYLNLQRFILFQLTVNVVACLTVLCGSFMGMQPALTVTQMLWVNLIMDTFAAMALSSLPPSRSVMSKPPRNRSDFIINRPMWGFILSAGLIFFGVLMGLMYYLDHTDLTSVLQIGQLPWISENKGLSPREMSIFFNVFIFLQFWNMFNAKAYATRRSALHFKGCGEFLFIAALIFFGQILIVTVGGAFFNVVPLPLTDWIVIIAATSPVLWIGELLRLLHKKDTPEAQ